MKVCFLFGSGVSVPAGMPKVSEITERVMLGDDPSPPPNSASLDSKKEERQGFLRWLEIQIKRRYTSEPDRYVNYEDLYFLANQIYDDLNAEYDNPAVRPLIEKAFAEVLPSATGPRSTLEQELKHLSKDAIVYMRRCVMLLLRAELQPLDYLEFVAEAVRASGDSGLDILTLNHDTVLERFLENREVPIPFADGFAEEVNIVKVRQWQPAGLQKRRDMIRLLKLHGGIDWYRFRPHGVQDWHKDYFGIPTPEYLSTPSLRDEDDRIHEWPDGLPFFLIGTFNKIGKYTDPIYIEIYYRAFQLLEEIDALLVVGYGFGDKGINKLITNWMSRNLERRLIVVGRDADNLWRRARGAIASKWGDWLGARRLFVLSFELENKLSWWQIKRVLS